MDTLKNLHPGCEYAIYKKGNLLAQRAQYVMWDGDCHCFFDATGPNAKYYIKHDPSTYTCLNELESEMLAVIRTMSSKLYEAADYVRNIANNQVSACIEASDDFFHNADFSVLNQYGIIR